MITSPTKTTGERLEGVAFQFCKIATVAFLAGRYTLPVASSLAAILYLAAHFKGKRDTRCILRYPVLISAFWGTVSVIAWIFIINPEIPAALLKSVGLGK
ncbi:MAG: hypothetical protein BGO01_08220 [Armatimonadetes bacterium 55-13]|nr:hypothetical protein [Armatimonadota bacterium]OJU62457.1 MAG: hypothetical protein BGO01_08220 [Armatimonadetes bacterium 55-13]